MGAWMAVIDRELRTRRGIRPRILLLAALLPLAVALRPADAQSDADVGPIGVGAGNAATKSLQPGGQVWREYDLRGYLRRVQGLEEPHQPVVDWILRETGTARWFGSVPGMIAMEEGSLRVYHLPEVQQTVEDIVKRFADQQLSQWAVSVSLMTVESVNWRSIAMPMLQPVRVETPGVEAWLIRKEDAAVLMGHLRQRVDFRQHTARSVLITHGQSHRIERWQPRSYPQSVFRTPDRYPGFQVQSGQIQEGYRLQLSPLMQADGKMVDVVIQCQVDQVEKMSPLWMEVPTVSDPRAGAEIQVPQLSSWRVQERFRWPVDQILIISRGLVAVPGATRDNFGMLPPLLGNRAARADALLVLQCREAGPATVQGPEREARAGSLNYHGRY